MASEQRVTSAVVAAVKKEHERQLELIKKVPEEHLHPILLSAEAMREHAQYNFLMYPHLPDEEKVNAAYAHDKAFYDKYPVVCRYIVCEGAYSLKAFYQYLRDCENNPPASQDDWFKRTADYVVSLINEISMKPLSRKNKKTVWHDTYSSLVQEDKKFKEEQKNSQEEQKRREIKAKASLIRDLARRLHESGSAKDRKAYRESATASRYRIQHAAFTKSLPSQLKYFPHTHEARGRNIGLAEQFEDEMYFNALSSKYVKT